MNRNVKQSDRDISADAPSRNGREWAAHLVEQSDIAELFDELARQRFGQWISEARLTFPFAAAAALLGVAVTRALRLDA